MNTPLDTYFFDPELARTTALRQRRVPLAPGVDGAQLCYHDGAAFADSPPQLIAVPFEQVADYFATSPTRLPEHIEMGGQASNAATGELETRLLIQLREAIERRGVRSQYYTEALQQQEIVATESPRIFLCASRETPQRLTQMQTLGAALVARGAKVLVFTEENDRQRLTPDQVFQRLFEFEATLIIDIGGVHTELLAPGTQRVIWYPQPSPDIIARQVPAWREHDRVLSGHPALDPYLHDCGAPWLSRLSPAVDLDIFHPQKNVTREDKIVFIGPSQLERLRDTPGENPALCTLYQQLHNGQPLTEDFLTALAAQHDLPYEYVFWELLAFVVNDMALQWLCTHAPLPVKVIGQHWEHDDIIMPHWSNKWRHEKPTDKQLATLYNGARYAFIAQPPEMQIEAIAQAAACGCIPIVFDCAAYSSPSFWEQHCITVSYNSNLSQCLKKMPVRPATELSKTYSYLKAAEVLLATIEAS